MLPQGKTRVFESLLLAIFLAWMFPLASNARTSISTRKLLHLPLTLKELFGIRLITLLIPPYAWVILGGSLAICYPIIRAQNPVAGVTAAFFFIVFSALTGLTIAQLLSIALEKVVLCGSGVVRARHLLSGPARWWPALVIALVLSADLAGGPRRLGHEIVGCCL